MLPHWRDKLVVEYLCNVYSKNDEEGLVLELLVRYGASCLQETATNCFSFLFYIAPPIGM